jgi:hypothetical protein
MHLSNLAISFAPAKNPASFCDRTSGGDRLGGDGVAGAFWSALTGFDLFR